MVRCLKAPSCRSSAVSEVESTGAFQQLLGEIKLLRGDLAWIKKSADETTGQVSDIDKRLRNVEAGQIAIQAAQRPAISWAAVVTIVISALVAALVLLDRIYVPQ
jgi:hypothetical protein